ncbi:hypothetical protein LINGRAPRIM_LOCUS3413 [Linum grandiflorum]
MLGIFQSLILLFLSRASTFQTSA